MASSSPSSSNTGVAGRTDYGAWDKKTKSLVEQVEQVEKEETEQSKAALGLDGKYARSQAEAEERQKLKDVQQVKKKLEAYKQRETATVQNLKNLLGPVSNISNDNNNKHAEEENACDATIVRITRDRLEAGKRVVSITDTSGKSQKDTIVLTQDLSSLESKMMVNQHAKSFPGSDAENAVPDEPKNKERSVFGIIKCFVSNVHNCTIIIKCKVISGVLEMHNCSNVHVQIEQEATVATLQIDLSENLTIDFKDAPSGKNTALSGEKKLVRSHYCCVDNVAVRFLFVMDECTYSYSYSFCFFSNL
jgi:hypothetical protein